MKDHPANDKYFKECDDGIIYGTKYFYQVYHNCIDNLWLISTAENTGIGKGNQDSLLWLDGHSSFGQLFFKSKEVGGKETINQQSILYTTVDGRMLAQVAREWFKKTYANKIYAVGYVRKNVLKITQDRLEKMSQQNELEGDSHKSKKLRMEEMAKLALLKYIMEYKKSSAESSSGSSRRSSDASIPTSDAEISNKNLSKMEKAIEKLAQSQPMEIKKVISAAKKTYSTKKDEKKDSAKPTSNLRK
jgi:hypothetical protein